MTSCTKNSVIKSLTSSTVVLTLVCLAAVDFTLVKCRPLQYINDLRFIPLDQHPMFSKIHVYLESSEKVDVLILGSSLPMCAIAEYDEKLFGAPRCADATQLRRYLGAKYLQQQLAAKSSRSVEVANLSIVACMASDMYILFEKSLAAGKKPAVAVLCIAPRDFVDNMVQPIGRTPAFELLQDWKSLGDVLNCDLSSAEVRDLLISAVWYYYRVKVDYHAVLSQYFSNFFNRPTTLYNSTHSLFQPRQKTVEAKAETPADLSSPACNRYVPPNFKRFALEIDYLRNLLELCKKEKVECIVVNMPMSLSHRAILDKKLDQQYVIETEKACLRCGAHYLNFNDSEFDDKDFSDGFHVNNSGAEKFMKRLAKALINTTGAFR